ncbi:unnamed protein product [Heterosigma akashiwo]
MRLNATASPAVAPSIIPALAGSIKKVTASAQVAATLPKLSGGASLNLNCTNASSSSLKYMQLQSVRL